MPKYLLSRKQLVLDVIQEYLDRNRIIKANDLINFINSRFSKTSININNRGVKEIVKQLLKKNLIIEKSKLLRNNVLINQNRKEIYDFIINNPGIHFNKLCKKLNLSTAVINWHLNILLKFNFIFKEKIENFDAYFDSKINLEFTKILHFISRERYRKILEFFEGNNKAISKSRLSKQLGIHRNTITKYVEKLCEIGILLKNVISNKTIYTLNVKFYKKVRSI
ncbi:MAG: winged helix-turn-helix transcriptional regulator [Promethearchaeota archaeon]